MFSNQLITQELFSRGQSSQEQSNQNDFSQLQHAQFTQFDMTQPQSQDFFSQDQCSAGSNSQSQGMRAPVLDKYMPKTSLFKSNSQSRISTLSRPSLGENQVLRKKNNRPNIQTCNFQQQLSIQKMKPEERDERDLLSSIVSMVQECTEKRDEKIYELLQLKKCNEGESSSLLNSLKTFILEQQSQSEQKIQKVLESVQEQLKLTNELGNNHRHGFEENNKHFIDVKYTTARQIQDVEKRLLDELVTIRDDFDRQRRDLETFFRNQILSAQQKQLHTIEQHVQKSFADMTEGLSQILYKADEMHGKHSELKALGKSQQRELEKYIKCQSTEQAKQIMKQSQDLYSKQQKIIHEEINQTLETFTKEQKQVLDENKNCLNELKKCVSDKDTRPWQNENVPKMIQDKLDELHNYHQSEIKRLETEIENQQKKNDMPQKEANSRSNEEDAVNNILQNICDLQENGNDIKESSTYRRRDRGTMFKNGPGLLSPRPLQGTSWNSRTLFGRTNPSPIATVLPQRKQAQDTTMTAKDAVQTIKAYEHSDDGHAQTRLLENRYRKNENIQPATTGRQKSVRISHDTFVDSCFSSETADQISNTAVHSINLKKQHKKKRGRKKGGKRKRSGNNIFPKPGNKPINENKQSSQRNTDSCQIVKMGCNKNSIDYERKQTDSSTTSSEGKEILDTFQTSTVCSEVVSPKNIFDFHDELSPGPVLRKQKQNSVLIGETLQIRMFVDYVALPKRENCVTEQKILQIRKWEMLKEILQ
ncbi:uncharacterized protein LOC123529339 isoform X2 [Mercenaria mercenaria]|uniref:uncharacterized protein LOC123529339 isoform X2 n=1 Tax=Mercenaria mercenaria TaxID=6596 RepID=UPI00234EB608|nr:uncharacterized protein LOC123529339 isoform X2 [Mercenaria mercenaria]